MLFILGISTDGDAQIYFENFGFEPDCSSQGNSADGFDPGEGPWSVTIGAGSGFVANQWYISNSAVGGGFVGACVTDCAGGGERT
ncbi:MAG TPA: hypothetical protein VJ894_00290, partial [Cryomorphaceae bacterium]|nr:hypothetical protein [Cryomorphaceae bacterium]